MKIDELRDKANRLPLLPGVYIMKDVRGEVIYVGKAKALKNRVTSYFRGEHLPKVAAMVAKVDDFDVIVVKTEFEALVLENSLIKRHKPHYNILLKDDKGYPFIRLDVKSEYPRFTLANRTAKDGAKYFGPFGGRSQTRDIIDTVCKALHLPTCSRRFPRDIDKARPCLNYHMGACAGWCRSGHSSEEYRAAIAQAELVLSGRTKELIEDLTRQMEAAAEDLKFELAASLRDRIRAVEGLENRQRVIYAVYADTDAVGFYRGARTCFTVLHYVNGNLADKAKLKRGSLEVTKTSEDGLVEGMTFHLSGTSLSGQPVDEYAVTDGNGVAHFENVLIGSGYVLEEVDTPIRYVVPDSQTATIEWNEVTHKSVNNVLKKFRVTVTKSDVETGAPQGDGSLAGAVYGLYKGDTLIDSFTTDENGQFTTGYYVCDSDWTIREISPSEGYLLDSTIHKVGAEPELYTIELNDTANDVTEQVIKGDIAIIKHTDDGETQIETPESGAEFQVFLKSAGSYENAKESERDVLVCDENGFAQSKKLPYGTYIVRQTKGWEGRELMDDFEVYIAQDGQTYRYLINNANFASFIKVVKVDAETGVTIPYAGAGFQIYRPDGSKVEMTFTYPTPTTIDTFYTNSEGYLVTPEKLEYGSGYSLVEVQAPYGYVLDSTPVYFDVTEDNSSEEGGVTVIEVTKPNMAQKGIIKVSKTGEVFSSVTENEGVYQPVYEVQGLPGAVFEITALEDVYTLDGTLRYSAGEVVDTITTGEDGTAQSQPLYLGKFQVKETQFPHGMVDTGENITNVELVYAGQEVEVTETSASFYNQRQKALVTLDKVLEQDETFGIGMNGEISAVTFGLYAQEDITAADGSVIPADGLLEIVSVNENGQAICSTDLPFGSFYLKELSTDSHYLLNGETLPFTFEYGGPSIAVVEISANDGEAVTNELIRGEIKGLKTDENGTGLGGAVIGLFKSDETEFTAENALATATSAEDGSFSFAGVPYGNWVLKELESPEGFILSDEVIPVTVEEDGQVVEISLANERVYGDLRLTKVDKDYPDNKLTGAEFEVYRDTNGNKELDEGDELLGKLEETSTGIYEMAHILYGGVFVKETKAPEGFLLDENAYYVEITENGKIYVVENEAGIGFTNMAQTGSLRIEKTSSDGNVEDFSFRVTGANGYDQTFKTDKNGEIFIEGLRVGDYTVSEVSDGASANYVLPADKTVTIFADKTTVAEMHNELRDTPKTGDDSKPWLWAALMGVSAMGAAALGVAAYVGKRKKGKNTVK